MQRSRSDGPSRGRRNRRITTSLLASVAVAAGGVAALTPTAASAAPTQPVTVRRATAPVLDGAARGGAVIVWMKSQHAGINLRTHGLERARADRRDQKPVVASIRAHGGTDILRLVSVSAVAAHMSAAEVRRLSHLASVKQIVPDSTVQVGEPLKIGPTESGARITPDLVAKAHARASAKPNVARPNAAPAATNPFPTANNCGTQANPLIEPEALSDINAPAMTNLGLSTEPGHGVVVSNDGISTPPTGDLVGNPNFVRPASDGGGSVVEGATAGDTTDSTDGEYYGDASSIDAQGTVTYDYASELPYSGLPAATCYFKLVGDAPGASLVDARNISTPESAAADPSVMSESQIVAGIDAAVVKYHADVINESYGYSNTPGAYATHYAANDAAVASGVTVVASSGDSGDTGTVSSPASDPLIIAAGATNTLRLNAMAYGFTGWVNDDITPLSSGGTTPNNKLVDLVAPGYGGEAACNPNGSDCPTNTQTEAFGGTSEASPLIAGAAADVIQAYRDSHNGDSPSPALVKQLLVSTATDIDAPADQQGAGLVNIGAAVAAAQQTRNTTAAKIADPALVTSTTQLDLTGNGGVSSNQTVSLYNADSTATTVTGTYRELGPETPIGSTVTEQVSTPDASVPVPSDGEQAAPDVTFTVPAGLDRLDADMIWPDPTNGNVLNFVLTDPSGRLRQISYDYGAAKTGGIGSVPNIQHVEVANPTAGTWTAQIKWGNGRSHLQEAPNVPTSYTGPVSFKVAGQNFVTSPASAPVSIASHGTANIPLSVAMPQSPGDHPESVQFTGTNAAGAQTVVMSLPIARRTLVPSAGGPFTTMFSSSVGRGLGGIQTYDINVPAGDPDLGVTMETADASADNPMSFYLVNPTGTAVTHLVSGRATSANTFVANAGGQGVTAHVANPGAGTWEIDVKLNLTTSGKEFQQTVFGDVLPQAPVITAPANGSTVTTLTPTISGTGVTGDTVSVTDSTGDAICTATVLGDGTWSCTSATLTTGPVTLSATQADSSGDPSSPSASVAITVPTQSSVALTADPTMPTYGQQITLTATSTNVPDGTTVTFSEANTTLGTGTVTSGVATLTLTDGLAVGDHVLSATVAATPTSTTSTSSPVDVTVGKNDAAISLGVTPSAPTYGQAIDLTATTTDVPDGTTVTFTDGTSTTLGTGTVSGGVAALELPTGLAVGDHMLTASAPATDTSTESGSPPVDVTVGKQTTTTSLLVNPSAPTVGQEVDLTADTTDVPDGTTVTFLDGSTVLGTGATTNGVATLAVAQGLAAGSHALTASTPATGTGTMSTSTPVDIMVSRHGSSIALIMSASTTGYGHQITGAVAVGGATGGSVTVTYGATTKTVPLGADGTAMFAISAALRTGSHTFIATYPGTDSIAPSGPVSSTVTVTKDASMTGVTLSALSKTVSVGDTAYLLVTVSGHAGGNYPTGTITIVAVTGTRHSITTGALAGSEHGKRTFHVPLPNEVGRSTLRASYSGDDNYTSSIAPPQTVTVTKG